MLPWDEMFSLVLMRNSAGDAEASIVGRQNAPRYSQHLIF